MSESAPCAWVFAGGDFCSSDMPHSEVGEQDIFICVDRGLQHCLGAGYQPSLLIGDLDSVSPSALTDQRVAGVERHVYPREKAASDLEIALDLLCENPPQRVVLLGVSGGRTDHMLFNWYLSAMRQWPFRLQYIDATSRSYILQQADSITFDTRHGQTISLLPLTASLGVCTSGLHYALSAATLSPGSTLGLSNVAEAETVQVMIDSGTLLVMANTDFEGCVKDNDVN